MRDIVLLATADWDNPFWTNKQHVACQLAARGCRVLYVDSLGLRRPSARSQDLARMARRLRRALAAPRRVRPDLHVWSPVVVPLQQHAAVRTLNRRVLSAALALQLRRLGFTRPLLWTYNPLTPRLLDLDAFAHVVYHCVDDIAAQPGMPAAVLALAEEQLTRRADIVFATSPRLAETRRLWNPGTHFLPNVADFEHFAQAMAAETVVPADLLRIPGPRLGFIGAISGYKVDFDLLRSIALARRDWSIVLIGKVGEGDPWTDPAKLEGLPNLYQLGPRPYAELPAYLKGMDVALLPSTQNEYTASMFPMKFFEYLAAGRPVVSVDLLALRDFAAAVTVATSPDGFIAAIDRVLHGQAPALALRLDLARQHTWGARTARMLDMIAHCTGGAGRTARVPVEERAA
jgi:glycosyltransferase involved in cell wall biosynthesis